MLMASAQDRMTQNGAFDLAGIVVRDQGQRDDAHGLLRVVRAVRQGHHAGRPDLPDPEAVVARRLGEAAADPVQQVRPRRRDQRGDDRRQGGRDDDLGDQAVPLDRMAPRGGERGADYPADQRVRRTRRNSEQPGEQVPDDPAAQPGGHHGQRHQLGAHQAAGDRGRDGQGQERADEVQQARQGDRDPRIERLGRDGGRHRVGRVVEAVGEVKAESGDDHQHQDRSIPHATSVPTRPAAVESLPERSSDCHDEVRQSSSILQFRNRDGRVCPTRPHPRAAGRRRAGGAARRSGNRQGEPGN